MRVAGITRGAWLQMLHGIFFLLQDTFFQKQGRLAHHNLTNFHYKKLNLRSENCKLAM